jgi:nucleoside-diphosphate-sugar epimerase
VQVLLTGGTGFVGSHTVPALLARGHRPRLLVRDEKRADDALARRGVDPSSVEVVVGDVTDRASVERAVEGCDAVVHAAAAIGITDAGNASTHDQNVGGTRAVVEAALAVGCDPIVHVSTVAVFVPPSEPIITAQSPLASPRNEYGRSKVEAERWVRERQDEGAPVTIVYPGGVLGPDQPRLDAAMEGIAAARKVAWPMAPGGVCLIDVRDLADALAAAIEPGQGPRRLLLGGAFYTWPELGDLTDDICGVRARRLPMPRPVLLGAGSALDLIRRVVPLPYPLTRDAAEIMITMAPTEDGPALDTLGITLRPVRETLADALRWMVDAGHLPADAAPNLVA